MNKKPAFVNSIEFEDCEVWDSIETGIKEKILLLGFSKGPKQLSLPLDSAPKKRQKNGS